ncbi:hypothetical protein PCANC_19705 [Puccinia coronata f. sp. avenae]|uniref:Uncharacterized protein n=1 Tax=Puccinia coronata f. sp. avenae TaxID=200324 RepID=A0A2N5SAX3_9BASI|nr:hypothetical protein PCANC_19705 [Puccinia coronata f. sp. avenae]
MPPKKTAQLKEICLCTTYGCCSHSHLDPEGKSCPGVILTRNSVKNHQLADEKAKFAKLDIPTHVHEHKANLVRGLNLLSLGLCDPSTSQIQLEVTESHCQKLWLGWLHPSLYWMRPSDSNLGMRHQVNRSLIQTQRPNAWAAEFESVSDSLGGARPSLNQMAASDINSDAAIRSNFSGSVSVTQLVTIIPGTSAIWHGLRLQ